MRKGFTILELLVASLLLGMLMTILTMIFNQSSIAWKTGEASVRGIENTAADVSDIRYQADNGYEWNGQKYIHSVFKDDGSIATRTDYINENCEQSGNVTITLKDGTGNAKDAYSTGGVDVQSVTEEGTKDPYIVNVRSWGPDRKENTRYDNVYSLSPTDDPSEW